MRNSSSGSDEAGPAADSRLATVSYLSEARPASSRRRSAAPVGDPAATDDSTASQPVLATSAPDTARPVASISGVALGGELPDNEPEVVERAVVEQRVLRALGRKALSEKEVRALIAENGLEGPEVEEIVERLVELRYVDDNTLAEELTRRLSEKKGQSKSAVGRSLAARGLPSEVVSEALSEIDDGEERRVAFEIAEKRARQMGSLDAQTLERRLSGFLARRGYPGGLVRDIVSEIARRRPSAPSGPRFR